MALSANGIWDVRNDGSDSNAGYFNPANSNMATDLAATSATGASPVVTSASYNFVAGDVGHWLFIQAGTNWIPGWYQIASVAANAATLTAGVGAGYKLLNTRPWIPTTVAGVATTASPTGGTWSIDYSQQATARTSYTDMVIGVTTTTYTSAANPITAALVGNSISVASGTGFTVQTVEIVSVNLGGLVATCDKSLGTTGSTGGTGAMGGYKATPGSVLASSYAGSQSAIFLQYNATAYTCSASANVAGGKLDFSTASGGYVYGWATSRCITNRDANRPTLNAGANSIAVYVSGGGFNAWIYNVIIAGNGKTGVQAFQIDGRCGATNCKASAVANAFVMAASRGVTIDCEVNACTASGFNHSGTGCQSYNCTAISCTCAGFTSGAGSAFVNCAGINNANAGGDFALGADSVQCINCLSYNNTSGPGFSMTSVVGGQVCQNCIAASSSTYGFKLNAANPGNQLINCFGWNNTTADYDTVFASVVGFTALTADPFTNKAGNDFSLNSTAGGGAAVKAASFPSSLPGLSTNNYLDGGPVQSAAPAAGGLLKNQSMTGGMV